MEGKSMDLSMQANIIPPSEDLNTFNNTNACNRHLMTSSVCF
jgi:hypothetical protein